MNPDTDPRYGGASVAHTAAGGLQQTSAQVGQTEQLIRNISGLRERLDQIMVRLETHFGSPHTASCASEPAEPPPGHSIGKALALTGFCHALATRIEATLDNA